jgi:hypothetical protein
MAAPEFDQKKAKLITLNGYEIFIRLEVYLGVKIVVFFVNGTS